MNSLSARAQRQEQEELCEEGQVPQTITKFDKQLALSTYDTALYDYNAVVLSFGFVVLFGAAWPLTPLVVCLYNFSQVFIDKSRLLDQYKRPLYVSQVLRHSHSSPFNTNIRDPI